MKTLTILFLAGVLALSGCKKGDDTTTVTSTKPNYQIAIAANHVAMAMGWDKDGHAADNGGNAIQTKATKGWVQYYTFLLGEQYGCSGFLGQGRCYVSSCWL